MWTWIGKVLCVASVCAAFLTIGFVVGSKRPSIRVVSAAESGRFQRLTDTTALDTKTGMTCSTVSGIQIDPQTGERVQNVPPLCAAR